MASAVDRTSSPRSALSSPWSHVVRGEDQRGGGGGAAASSPSASPMKLPGRSARKQSADAQQPVSSMDLVHGGGGSAAEDASMPPGKKPVWNVPSNGSIEAGSVMDSISWPALSESARSSPKSSSSDSMKALSDGSVSASPGSVSSYPSANQASSNQNPNSTPNASSSRHKTMKRDAVTGSGGGSSGGAASEASQVVTETTPKGFMDRNSSSHNNNNGGNDHLRGYGGGRKGGNGHHNNYGNRRDPERGGHEWSRHRDFGRDAHMQPHQQRGDRSYSRPPPVAPAPFISPSSPVGPFASHMGFPEFPSPVYYVTAPPHPESLRVVPFAPHQVPAPQMMFFPAPDPQRTMLLKQIEYYFSQDNLCKDLYLRQNMDKQGWVPISLIASFNKVKRLTNSIQYLVDTVQLSSVVEVQGEKLRKRNDWKTWLLPPTHLGPASALQSPKLTTHDGLAVQFENVGLDDTPKSRSANRSRFNEAVLSREFGDSNEHKGSQAGVYFN
ncbi:hypothetical protein AXF42_Ash009816 [Apostasia shenzhenica]|uniref:HTH La-type RNA-binding domain-containing protein n=1 Tax=Apostasia shenzhenica TaxID=1088818 RepID=A0A2I0AX60_9ASPA|nr:hypothetical protein AXF42_Ash009816 [Apostasia shenzhenica]